MKKATLKEKFEKIEKKVIYVLASLSLSLSMPFGNIVSAEGEVTEQSQNSTAPEPATAEGAWNTIMQTFFDWIPRLGIALAVFGAIEFGIAVKSEDADGKTKGLRTVIAGIIVVAAVKATEGLLTA